MIRREVRFADGVPQWLLISQLEHARLSGELAGRCIARLGDATNQLAEVRQELLQAIFHHDDGWAEWEADPRLDPQGRPFSVFELPLVESLQLWDQSIQAASAIGPLAAWVVAGHFSALLCTVGHHTNETIASNWLRNIAEQRSTGFAIWHRANPTHHKAEIAGEALKWLQLFDILSLWPCAHYPVSGEQALPRPEPLQTAENWTLVREIRPSSQQTPGEQFRIVFDPWPFEEHEFHVQVAAHLVPVRHYPSAAELLTARVPYPAEWIFAQL